MDENVTRPIPSSPWRLIEEGDYAAALTEFARLYQSSRGEHYLFNRGSLYLQLGDYHSALQEFNQILEVIDLSVIADSHYIFQGICYWGLGQPERALDSWQRSLSVPYADAAGGVTGPALLLYGAERLHLAEWRRYALALLRGYKRRNLPMWPGPIAPYLLGVLDELDLIKYARDARSDDVAERQQRQALFYVGLHAFQAGDEAGFRERMESSAGHPRPGDFGEGERYLARWEVQRGFPDPAFPGRESARVSP